MLIGELVTLRAIEPDDYPMLARWANDVEVELLGGGDPPAPRPLTSVSAMFDRMRDDRDASNFAIVADGLLIGQLGLHGVDHAASTAELGITIGNREYWGRGYGREALLLALDYGFRLRNLRKIWLTVNASNERAIRAYAAVGFVEEGRQREQVWNAGHYDDLVYMGIIRPPSGGR
ncbi:MAG: GNAT family protein [Actinomycetota bacterium]